MIGPRRPAIWALRLAVLAVATGVIATGVHVARGVDERRVPYSGRLDAEEILSYYQPALREGKARPLEPGEALLESARGTVEVHGASGALLAFWAFVELLPWLLAVATLVAIAPILRAADRGDPFGPEVGRRLARAGSLLLVGIPAVTFLRFVLAEAGTSGGGFSPGVDPSWTISVLHFLPGLLLLAFAGIFRQGAELRDLERHTV
jgi:hypothetical protein